MSEKEKTEGLCELCAQFKELPDRLYCKDCLALMKIGGLWSTG